MYEYIPLTKLLPLLAILHTALANDYSLELKSNSPVVLGGIVHFEANLLDQGVPASGSFQFEWEDDSMAMHTRTVDTNKPHDSWSLNYTGQSFPPGPYIMQVSVKKYYFIVPIVVTSRRIKFILTDHLNGEMQLSQHSKVINSVYVSNTTEVLHEIQLKPSDAEYLNRSATNILTYWFVDCNYYGMSSDFKFTMNYTDVDQQHRVEALVLVDFDPLPTPPPSTTTVAPTTTTIKPTTTTTTTKPTTTTTTIKLTTTKSITSQPANAIIKDRQKRHAAITNFNGTNDIVAKLHNRFVTLNDSTTYNDSLPFICNNHTIIPLGPNLTYGYFYKKIAVRQPVTKISVTGNNWIQPGDLLQLSVSCNGSSNFHYCHTFKDGIYNVTGNESCHFYDISEKCDFPINRLFITNAVDIHTVIIIIFNDVSKEVYPVTVNFYKANVQAQLSVIVVPVAFSLVAVVLIVFGVAYYIQNRSRFIVEVADFNFGQQYSDLEYKTFRERLRDSITTAFTRAPLPGSSEGPVWPPGKKYGSMT